jgi:hypothetical protein
MLPTAEAEHAALLMEEAEIGCLPIVADGEVVGIVTRADLVRAGLAISSCVSCGSQRHLRRDPRGTGVFYCVDCLDDAGVDEDTELGLGD